ncbi:MAG: InlB B-repeat-containing protein, partial [Microbacteriaceae bacterium]|nr:InlB B-repeat-containing protein [Microbacteriaceae bacterium]
MTRTLVIGVLAAAAGIVGIASPAAAAEITWTDGGYTFTADEANPGAGAGIVSGPTGTVTTIPGTVTHDGTTYTVTGIGANAFAPSEAGQIGFGGTMLVIPSGVVTIGAQAFYQTTATQITVPASVTWIGSQAFWSVYAAPQYVTFLGAPPSFAGSYWNGTADNSFYTEIVRAQAGLPSQPNGRGVLRFACDTAGVTFPEFRGYPSAAAPGALCFDPNGGSGGVAAQHGASDAVPTPPATTRDHYVLTGWNSAPDGSGTALDLVNPYPFALLGQTVYAQWAPVPYSITYELQGGTATNPATYTVADTVVLSAPTLAGHAFAGWTSAALGISAPAVDVTIPAGTSGALDFEAHWTRPVFAPTVPHVVGYEQTTTGFELATLAPLTESTTVEFLGCTRLGESIRLRQTELTEGQERWITLPCENTYDPASGYALELPDLLLPIQGEFLSGPVDTTADGDGYTTAVFRFSDAASGLPDTTAEVVFDVVVLNTAPFALVQGQDSDDYSATINALGDFTASLSMFDQEFINQDSYIAHAELSLDNSGAHRVLLNAAALSALVSPDCAASTIITDTHLSMDCSINGLNTVLNAVQILGPRLLDDGESGLVTVVFSVDDLGTLGQCDLPYVSYEPCPLGDSTEITLQWIVLGPDEQEPGLAFPNPGTQLVGTSPALEAVAPSTVSFTSATPAVCTVTPIGGVLTLPAAGTCTITASAPGFTPATESFLVQEPVVIAFDGNGADSGAVASLSGLPYSTATVPSNGFARAHHVFVGWNTDPLGAGDAYAPGDDIALDAAGTLYAQWALVPVTVTFDPNGGSGSMASQVRDWGADAALSGSTFTPPTGHAFAGWNTAEDGSGDGYPGGADYAFEQDVTLYAQWTPVPITVAFDPNGGTGIMAPQVRDWSSEAPLTALGFVAPEHHVFAGWSTLQDGSGDDYAEGASYAFEASTTLYAQWALVPVTVTFDANGGTGTMNAQTRDWGSGAALSASTFAAPAQHVFAGWSTTEDGIGGSDYADGATYAFEADATLYAQWALGPAGTVPTFAAPTPGIESFTILITNYDPVASYQVATTAGTASLGLAGLVTVSGLDPEGYTAVLTVTVERAGFQDAQGQASGFPLRQTANVLGAVVLDVRGTSCVIGDTGLADPPVGSELPTGLLSFELSGCGVGASVPVVLRWTGLDPAHDYLPYKDSPATPIAGAVVEWDGAVLEVAYTVTDGGALDADGEEDGSISDPVGLAAVAPAAPGDGSGGTGGSGAAALGATGWDGGP